MKEQEFPRDRTGGDHALALIRGALGGVPIAGNSLVEALAYVVQSPLQDRQAEWLNQLADRVEQLEANGFSLAQLRSNPMFLDSVFTASQAALRTSSETKLEALRNIVTNSALPDAPARARQQMFLGFVERFSDLHIVLLRFAQDATKFSQPDGSPLPERSLGSHVLRDVFPDAGNDPIYDVAWSDLHAASLVRLPAVGNGPEGDARRIRRTTDFGDEFLAFITNRLPPA